MASFVADYFGKIGALAGSKMMMVLQKNTQMRKGS